FIGVCQTFLAVSTSHSCESFGIHSCINETPSVHANVFLTIIEHLISADGGLREYLRTRPVVHDGLLLYRVDVARYDLAIREQMELSVDDTPDPAEPDLSLADLAEPRAGCALYPSARERSLEFCLLSQRLRQRSRNDRHL